MVGQAPWCPRPVQARAGLQNGRHRCLTRCHRCWPRRQAVTLDPQQVEAAVRRNDAAAVAGLLRGATEAERKARARALKLLFDGPRTPYDNLVPVMLPPQEAGWIRLARAGRVDEVPAEVVARWQAARDEHA